MRKLGYVFTAALVAGCASKSTDISPSYVSPIMYQNHSCAQLAQEAQGISARAAQVSGAQDQKRTNDQIATGVAIVVFWPAAFFVGGDGPTSAELANLKGQMVAVEQASIQKNCGIQFQRSAGDGAVAPIAPVVAIEPSPVTKQASTPQRSSSKAKQARPVAAATAVPVAPSPVIVAEPPPPTISDADRAMSQRN
jgi:hypothetical protein